MSIIKHIARNHQEAEHYLHPENLDPRYDPSLVDAKEPSLELRSHIPFMPVLQERSFGKDTYVPVLDHESELTKYMALLVSRSRLVSDLYVIENIPYPSETAYPTRIGAGLNSKRIYPPIVGFVVHGSTHRLANKEIVLLTSDKANPDIERIGRMEDARTVAELLLVACMHAEHKFARYQSRKVNSASDAA